MNELYGLLGSRLEYRITSDNLKNEEKHEKKGVSG